MHYLAISRIEEAASLDVVPLTGPLTRRIRITFAEVRVRREPRVADRRCRLPLEVHGPQRFVRVVVVTRVPEIVRLDQRPGRVVNLLCDHPTVQAAVDVSRTDAAIARALDPAVREGALLPLDLA